MAQSSDNTHGIEALPPETQAAIKKSQASISPAMLQDIKDDVEAGRPSVQVAGHAMEVLSALNPALSWDAAMEHAAIKTPVVIERIETMDWEAMHASLAGMHEGNVQQTHLARLALEQARLALNELAALGHFFELKESKAAAVKEFPKMLYHPVDGMQAVNSQREQDLMSKNGWDVHPSLRDKSDE